MTRPRLPEIEPDVDAITVFMRGCSRRRDALYRKVAKRLREQHGKQVIVQIGHRLQVIATETHPLETLTSSVHGIVEALLPGHEPTVGKHRRSRIGRHHRRSRRPHTPARS